MSPDNKLCDNCGEQPATVNFVKAEGQIEKQVQLCEQCAQDQGYLPGSKEQTLSEFFKGATVNILGPTAAREQEEAEKLECPKCRLTLHEFERLGLLGCPKCYDVFNTELTVLLKRIHGSNKHIGSRPRPNRVFGNAPDIEALKRELRESIEQENYERAAEYRDFIRDLEREEYRNDRTGKSS